MLARHAIRHASRAASTACALATTFAATLALALAAPSARADELHLGDGRIVQGLLEAETRSGYSFVEAGKKRASTFRKADVRRVVLTYESPDVAFDDPQWSDEMVEARIAESFRPDWGEVEVLRSAHYIVFTNSSAGDRYSETMEDIYSRFLETFPFEEPKAAPLMPVFLFKTNDQYYQFYADIAGISLAEARKSAGHSWRDYYATYYDAPQDPVHYHEGAHQLVKLRLRAGGGGSWFQEGMAVYFEGTVFPGEDPAKGMKGQVKSGRHTPFEVFFKLSSLLYSSTNDTDPSLGSRRYQQAGALIKFLKEGPQAELWPTLLDQLRDGESWEDIFGQTYGLSIADLEAAFVEHYGG
jgi:hypothetical protein